MLSALLCSIDTYFAAAAIGLLGLTATRRQQFILAFAFSDALATMLGSGLHLVMGLRGIYAAWVVPAVIGALICFFSVRSRHLVSPIIRCLPILLSVDNFLAAFNGEPATPESILLGGAGTAVFAWCGFRSVDVWRHRGSPRPIYNKATFITKSPHETERSLHACFTQTLRRRLSLSCWSAYTEAAGKACPIAVGTSA